MPDPINIDSIISDIANPCIVQALALGRQGATIPVRLPSGIVVLAKAQTEINSSKILLSKTPSGGYICHADSSPKPTKRTQTIFKSYATKPIKQVGFVKVLLVTRNKDDDSLADIFIGGDRSPAQFITTISDYDKIQFSYCGITSFGKGLNEWVISIGQQYTSPNRAKITVLTPEKIVVYEDYSIEFLWFLEYKGAGVYSVPRISQFYYKEGVTGINRAKSIETQWLIPRFVGGIKINTTDTMLVNTFSTDVFSDQFEMYVRWDSFTSFPLLTYPLSSISFPDTNFAFSDLNSSLDQFVGGDYVSTINDTFTFNQFTALETFLNPSEYGFPDYIDREENRFFFSGGARVSLTKYQRNIVPNNFFANSYYFIKNSLFCFVGWDFLSLLLVDSINGYYLDSFILNTPIAFYHTTLEDNINLSSKAFNRGIRVQADNSEGWVRETLYGNSTYLFNRPTLSDVYESHNLDITIPLSDDFALISNINKSVKNSDFHITGNCHDLLLVGNGVFLSENIRLNESNITTENTTEWLLTSDSTVLTNLTDLDDLSITTSIKRISTDPAVFSVQFSTLANDQSLAVFDTIPEYSVEKHPVRIYSISDNVYVKKVESFSVTLDYPDDRSYTRVSISYHP